MNFKCKGSPLICIQSCLLCQGRLPVINTVKILVSLDIIFNMTGLCFAATSRNSLRSPTSAGNLVTWLLVLVLTDILLLVGMKLGKLMPFLAWQIIVLVNIVILVSFSILFGIFGLSNMDRVMDHLAEDHTDMDLERSIKVLYGCAIGLAVFEAFTFLLVNTAKNMLRQFIMEQAATRESHRIIVREISSYDREPRGTFSSHLEHLSQTLQICTQKEFQQKAKGRHWDVIVPVPEEQLEHDDIKNGHPIYHVQTENPMEPFQPLYSTVPMSASRNSSASFRNVSSENLILPYHLNKKN